MPRSECHFGVDNDVIVAAGNIVVKRAVNDTAAADDDGLEVVLFPFFVPVFSLDEGVGDFHCRPLGNAAQRYGLVETFGREIFFAHIGCQSGLVRDKGFITGLGKKSGQKVGAYFVARVKVDAHFDIVVHCQISNK